MSKILKEKVEEGIKSWDINDRPREKLLQMGRRHLTNAELIAILIRAGNVNESAVALSARLLKEYKYDLSLLAKADVHELCAFKGMGVAKALAIIAALEIGRRRKEVKFKVSKSITCSRDLYILLYPNFADLQQEEFWIVLLSRANKVIAQQRISVGGISGTVADPKVIFKIGLQHSASSIILAHNHPSGQLAPSNEDIKITRKLVEVGKIMDMQVLDHLIITDEGYLSFSDKGIL